MRDKIFTAVFAAALSIIFLSLPIARLLNIAPADTAALGSLETPAAAAKGPFLGVRTRFEQMKADMKNFSRANFPFYEAVLFAVPKADNAANAALYRAVPVSEYFPVKANEEYFFKNWQNGSVIRLYPYAKSYYEDGILEMSAFYNNLAKQHSDVNFSVYSMTSLSVTDALDGQNLNMDSHGEYVSRFAALLSPEVGFDYLKITDTETYAQWFYRSDHHWNIKGAYQGYKDAVRLLAEKNASVGEPIADVSFFEVPNVVFRGSAARLTADDSLTDSIWDMRKNLPPYTVTVNGMTFDSANLAGFSGKQAYLAGQIPAQKYYNHYADYFHGDYGEIQYDFQKGTKENLLVFVDSMSNCIEEYIASHYDKTFAVDLRYYEEQTGEKFNLREYIKENQISDVLFFTLSSGAMFRFPMELGVWE